MITQINTEAIALANYSLTIGRNLVAYRECGRGRVISLNSFFTPSYTCSTCGYQFIANVTKALVDYKSISFEKLNEEFGLFGILENEGNFTKCVEKLQTCQTIFDQINSVSE